MKDMEDIQVGICTHTHNTGINHQYDVNGSIDIKMADSNTPKGKRDLPSFTSASVFLSPLVGYVAFHVTFHGVVT